jgi:NAD(P)H dehydrogenase (quinone)
MHTLVIFTHPRPASLNASIRNVVLEELAAQGETVSAIDLYADSFDPPLRPQGDASLSRTPPSALVSGYRALIEKADRLVFIHPTWWGRPPAMFQGFAEQVFGAGWAYSYKKGRAVPALKGKRALVITTQGSPSALVRLYTGDVHRIMLRRLLFAFCGIRPTRFLEIYNAHGMTAERFAKTKAKIGKLLR